MADRDPKQPMWRPSPKRIAATNMTRFIDLVNDEHGTDLNDYLGLYEWSIEQPEDFWAAMWKFGGVIAQSDAHTVLEDGNLMPGAKWFAGSRLNFAENLLRYRDDQAAIVFRGEHGERREMTYAELYRNVATAAQSLREAGVQQGDRVAGFMPNIPETIIAMLAATSLGAVWSSCSPDFGISGVLDRFGQIAPKVLFCADGYYYNGKTIDSLDRVRSVLGELPSITRVVVVPFVNKSPDIAGIANAVLLDDFLGEAEEIDFQPLPFDAPLYVLYSSGTTGVPKCIVHGVGGTLLQHLKEHLLHTDLKRSDRIFYFTTCGWMMWNWLASALAAGATLVLFDGAPFHPNAGTLWRMAEEEGVTILGTSAKYISAVEKANCKPGEEFNLEALKAVLSTGSPLVPESFDFVYKHIKADLQLSSISGGTDIISCFALGNPILPVYRGELQCRGLGMNVKIFDEMGSAIVGEKGELVCTAPFPSMPIGFWNDPEGEKYHDAYFSRFEKIWCHGDYAELTERGGMIIYGRSDAVLNPGGVRIGTAEIYRQVEKLDEILESIVVGQDWEDDVRVVLFVRLREDQMLTEELEKKIRQTIRSNATPRHVPAKIIAVPDIPRTISGKIVELAVRNVIHDRPVKNTDALANPDALEAYKNIPELQTS